MTQSFSPLDEQLIAEAVIKGVSRIPGAALPIGPEANFSTVGPGWRVWGVAVNRVSGVLNIDVELVITIDKDRSIPTFSDRVRGMVRTEIQSLTPEQVGWINIRISDVHVTG